MVPGTIPDVWGTNGKLISFALIASGISGTIPAFRNATSLQAILKKNNLGGEKSATNPPGTSISGTLPDFRHMPNLKHLILNGD